MELASTYMTPISDSEPIVLQYKFYWVHERLWDQSWIDKYHAQAPSLAREIQSRRGSGASSTKYNCDDFAFEILVEFTSPNKLPLKIETGVHTFKNIDETLGAGVGSPATPAGFALDVAYSGGAPDVIRNSVPVSLDDLKPGDMFAEFNQKHIQVVVGVSANRIDIMQGNFPGVLTPQRKQGSFFYGGMILRSESTNDRESPYYLGVPVQNAVYENRNGQWLYSRIYGDNREWDATPWHDMSRRIRWNFLEFNKL